MFCHVTRALRGVVLKTVDVAKYFIARTTTDTGLRVVAEAARRVYQKGLHASAEFIQNMPIRFHHSYPNSITLLPR